LGRYEESEAVYRQAIALDPKYAAPWNNLGNLYLDCLGEFDQADACFRESLKLDAANSATQLNRVFLIRDFVGDVESARTQWRRLDASNWRKFLDVVLLQEALFAAYDANWGDARRELGRALDQTPQGLPPETLDDWERAAAVLIHLDFGAEFLALLEERGDQSRLRPYFEAVRIVHAGNPRLLRDLAPEVRVPTEKIHASILTRLDKLPKRTRRRKSPVVVEKKRKGKRA
ncbi:MAG: tetratricopeptide repeat protein, partial [Planctomycetota bacterium]|nr:tetratricopeptide repeat protein [Planctomycetota bacterium]